MKKNKYDFLEYDRITVETKILKKDDIERYYLGFGYEKVLEKQDVRLQNVVYLTFQRKHKIKHKDELQLLQVYLENDLNDMALFEAKKSSRATLVGILMGLLACLFFCGTGLILGLLPLTITYILLSCMLFMIGLSLSIINAVVCKRIFKSDHKKYQEKIEVVAVEVEEIFARAQVLVKEGANEK